VLFYVANWANVVVSTGTGPLTHTWSLAIEEQFYLIWPLILIAVLARRRRPPAVALAVAIVVVVVARWITWDQTHADWLYYATTSHCDGLLVGALLAVVLHPSGRRSLATAAAPRSAAAAWVGLVGIAGLMATLRITSTATYEFGLPLIAICTALVVWHLATADTGLLVRVLSFRPLVGVGVVSYGLYLYHFPVFQLVQNRGYSHLVQHGLEIGVTVVVTAFSWFVVEKPALRLKDRLTRPRGTTDGLALANPTV
jgi:peptidoglycan/LPS O-acetylase OafA/YrhL